MNTAKVKPTLPASVACGQHPEKTRHIGVCVRKWNRYIHHVELKAVPGKPGDGNPIILRDDNNSSDNLPEEFYVLRQSVHQGKAFSVCFSLLR